MEDNFYDRLPLAEDVHLGHPPSLDDRSRGMWIGDTQCSMLDVDAADGPVRLDDVAVVLGAARAKVEDLARDERLLALLAAELGAWAARRWSARSRR